MKMIKVLVVDDSAFNRQTLKDLLKNAGDIEVVGTATDGIDAMTKTLKLKPDLITLDVEMPRMDGFSFLRWLMHERPTPVLVVSSQSDKKTVFKALELGAVDFIAKPTSRASMELCAIEKDLVGKVRGIRGLNMKVLSNTLKLIAPVDDGLNRPAPPAFQSSTGLVAIGSSTGGPTALQVVLTKIPRDFPCGIVISQHMPRGFTKPFAERLNTLTGLRVKEAEHGDALEPGVALICPGGQHMTFKRRVGKVKVILDECAPDDKYIPSVDRMILSALDVYGENTLGVVLTGMGNDGKEGMTALHGRGGYTIAESEETAVVYGMPAEVVNAGAASKVLALDKIAAELIRTVMGDRRA